MEEIRVTTSGGGYPVLLGHRVYEKSLAGVIDAVGPRRVVVVGHATVLDLHGERLMASVGRGGGYRRLDILDIPEGEESKNLETVEEGYRFLLKKGIGRDDLLIAFGGGVVGDITGFLAATYHRGMAYLQVPTTLMAMVDSSIGGKVGVDMEGAKNAVGAFHQPQAVVSDMEVLETLPERELKNGLAEVAKYGFLYDRGLVEELQGWRETTPPPGLDMTGVISRCVAHKARVVERDERDRGGERALLNYGHTFGHALESSLRYRGIKHGEAVAAGMIMASRASELNGMAQEGLVEYHRRVLLPLLGEAGIPGGLEPGEIIRDMRSDKKRGERVRFVLLEAPQRPRMVESLPEGIVEAAVEGTLVDLRGG